MVRPERSAAVKILSTIAALGIAALALLDLPASDTPLTYRAASHAAQVVGVAAGVSLIVAALLTTRVTVTLLLGALAAVWFGQDLAALGDAAALSRSIAGGAAPFAAALALHLALALPDG